MRAPMRSRISCTASRGSILEQTHQNKAQVEDDTLVRNASTGRRNDVPAVELILELLPILPGKEALGGPWPIQYSVHGRQS